MDIVIGADPEGPHGPAAVEDAHAHAWACFVPLLDDFGINPLFFGLLVALNLQTAYLSPPVAMSAFYLKGVAPPHVTLNQIFMGMMPFMGIQVIALILLYIFPEIGLWLPSVLYK